MTITTTPAGAWWESACPTTATPSRSTGKRRTSTGLPVARVTFSWGENDKKIIEAGLAREREIAEAASAEITWNADDTAHLMGACRMGREPGTSVVDQWCRSWDVPNMFICDGSVFVTSAAVNPSLTIQAIAARTADYIIREAPTGKFRGPAEQALSA